MIYSNDTKIRLRRIEGQIRGILRMMDEEKNCKEVVAQLSAVRSAVDRTIAYIVSQNLERCLRAEMEKGRNQETEKLLQDAVSLLVKSR